MRVILTKTYTIEAAHRAFHCGDAGLRLHGHTFRIEIAVEGEMAPDAAWLMDYGEISSAFAPLRARLDHANLNDLEGLEDAPLPAIAAWIEERLRPALPMLKHVRVHADTDPEFKPVRLAADTAQGLPERIGFVFSAAQSLPHLPEDHPCRQLHGHTYRVEVGARDLERLEPHLRGVHAGLDHGCLNDVPGLGEATSERLCAWIWRRLAEQVDDLTVVVVQETDTARCIYHGK